MNDKRMRALLTLNGVLLVVLMLVTLAPSPATAQSRQPRAHGQYAMAAGRIQGRTESAIYVVDAANEEMVALLWDSSRRKYAPVGYRDLLADRRLRERKGR